MKGFVITLALAGLASTATLEAQIVGTRLPVPTTSSSVIVDGSWHAVGRDGNGNTIYERRTRDANGNIRIQRAVRDGNGNLRIVSTRTVQDNDNRDRNCQYTQNTNSIGDIIFGRTNTNDTYCEDVGNRVDGGWYQVGRGRDNNSIYERRTRDSRGNLIIQRARRNSNGTLTIISTRYANDNDKQWRKAQKQQEKDWKKEQKRHDKEHRKSQRGDDDDRRFSSATGGNDRYYVSSNAVASSNGKGKSHKNKH
jgi:hypothetical protein